MNVQKGDSYVRFEKEWEIAYDTAINKCFWFHIHKYAEVLDPGDVFVVIEKKCRECENLVPDKIFALGELQKMTLMRKVHPENEGTEGGG